MRVIRNLVLATLLVEAACGGDTEPPPKVVSAFDAGADGWTITGDGAFAYDAKSGNPGGCIKAVDQQWGTYFYFRAPAKFLGDNSDTYGKELRYDLKIDPEAVDVDEPEVYIEGEVSTGGSDEHPLMELEHLTIWYESWWAPGIDWATYSVPLTERGWKKGTLAAPQAVSAAEFKAVLGDMRALRIRGEGSTELDTGYLDNVQFGR